MLIRIPGTSANLGPGFDCFGIAWQCYNEIEFFPSGELAIEGCDEEYRNGDNLAFRGWNAAFAAAGRMAEPVKIVFGKTDVPVCRGLGSSAALIVGGAAAADAMYSLGLGRQGILDAATAVEGHPDNVAPAVFGGLTASAMDGKKAVTSFFPVSDRLHFTALIPDFELSTTLARLVLPDEVSRADAIFNVSRSALLLRALGDGDAALLGIAMDDRIHQPYRWGLIEGSGEAVAMAKDCGAVGVCISGAGPTILCAAEDEGFTERIRAAVAQRFPAWEVRAMPIDREGVRAV